MVRIKKYLENSDPKTGVISHDDQLVHGLRFRIVLHNKARTKEFIVVQGEETEITDYIARRPTVTETIEAVLANIITTDWQPEEQPCPNCGQPYNYESFKIDEIRALDLDAD